MPKESILKRILCSQALIDSSKILTGKFDGKDWQDLGQKLDKIAVAPLYIDDSSTVTVSEIRAKCHRLKQTKGLSMVVIDYLQLMQGSGRNDSRQQEISEISRSLKVMAKELGVPVVALSQLSRAVESRQDKRPMLADIRESGSIEQDADIVMFIYRDDYYNPDSEDKNTAEVILAKHRAGETGMFKLGWKGQYTKFVNIDYRVKEEQ
jgi:replicative DNA helicase